MRPGGVVARRISRSGIRSNSEPTISTLTTLTHRAWNLHHISPAREFDWNTRISCEFSMPKKRNYNFKQLQGKSSSPDPGVGQRNGEGASPSVNERLSELRKLEAKDAAAKKRELAESSNQKSVPPQVQTILGLPESTPPKSKARVRTRERLRTPGPAPPKSWLVGASGSGWSPALTVSLRGARRGLKNTANETDRSRPTELLRFARLSGLEAVDGRVGARRLTHIALKAIAESWELFDDEDYPILADIPLRLRLRLISYLCFYGPATNAGGIEALLQGTEILNHLDLASLVGHGNLTVKKVSKLLTRDDRPASDGAEETVVESWDAEEPHDQSIHPAPRLNRAAHLTHLCLSHPGPGASWRELLSFSKHVPQVTHLSLAYWPWPTLTPNLATATVSGQQGQAVTAGGSHFYAAMDQSLEEPALLLRQLSNSLLCLQWLDVEGCQQWSAALAALARMSRPAEQTVSRRNDWSTPRSEPPILMTNWKNLAYIRWAQGWLPTYWGVHSLLSSNSMTVSAMEVLVGRGMENHLQLQQINSYGLQELPEQLTNDQIDAEKKKARIWIQAEGRLGQAALNITLARRDYGGKYINMDYGWETALLDPSKLVPRT